MPKETSKKKLLPFENGDLALTVAGTSIGSVTPFLLREYVDSYAPEGVWPGVIPIEWGRPSVIGSIGLGIGCLIGGVFSKSLRLFLLPLGIASTSVGVLMGVFPTPPSSAIRLVQTTSPGRLNSPAPGRSNITLRSAGNPGGMTLKSAGSVNKPGSNFMQKNPQERLLQLKKESEDLDAQKEAEKLEEDIRFRKSQSSSGIPLRT